MDVRCDWMYANQVKDIFLYFWLQTTCSGANDRNLSEASVEWKLFFFAKLRINVRPGFLLFFSRSRSFDHSVISKEFAKECRVFQLPAQIYHFTCSRCASQNYFLSGQMVNASNEHQFREVYIFGHSERPKRGQNRSFSGPFFFFVVFCTTMNEGGRSTPRHAHVFYQ